MAEKQAEGAAATTTTEEKSFLDQMLQGGLRPQNEEATQRGKDMISAFVSQLMAGRTVSRRVDASIREWVKELDNLLSAQVSEIMHHPDFRKLEGSWRGLDYLIRNSQTSTTLKVKMLNVTKNDMLRDLERAMEFDDSALFRKVYTEQYDQFGGEPFSALVGDYEIDNTADDMSLISRVSQIAAAAHAPFIASAGPGMFGLNSFTDLSKPKDLARIFDTVEFAAWKTFRNSDDSRYAALTMPRVMARVPYGAKTKKVEEFNFEEEVKDHEDYCWSNASFTYAARLTEAFFQSGWCARIIGPEGGGGVEGLPTHVVKDPDGDSVMKCPSEIAISETRDKQLSDLGFIPLCHRMNTDVAAFFSAQSCRKPQKYDNPDATANEELSAMINHILCTSRFAHYLKAMARDRIGTFMERRDCERWLNDWILNYVVANPDDVGPEVKAARPLRDARVEVREIKEKPGCYEAVAYMRPHFQLKELSVSMRLVAELPPPAGG